MNFNSIQKPVGFFKWQGNEKQDEVELQEINGESNNTDFSGVGSLDSYDQQNIKCFSIDDLHLVDEEIPSLNGLPEDIHDQLALAEKGRLNEKLRTTMKDAAIQSAIKRKLLTKDEVNESPDAAMLITHNKFVRDDIIVGNRTKNDVLAFNEWQIKALENELVQTDLEKGELTVAEVLEWNSDQVSVLDNEWIKYCLPRKYVTIKVVMERTSSDNVLLWKELAQAHTSGVWVRFYYGMTAYKAIKSTSPDAIRFLSLREREWGIQAEKDGLFTVDQILNLKPEQIAILYEKPVQWAMENKELLIIDFDSLSSDELLAKAVEAFSKRVPISEDSKRVPISEDTSKENCSIQ